MPDAHHPSLSLTKRTVLTTVALIAGIWAGAAAAQVPYLEWNGKSTPPPKPEPALSETLPLAATAQPAFDIPPSPYGQVGDPFLRPLKWPGKPTPKPTPSATPAPVPAPMPVNMTPPPAPRAAPKPIAPPVAPIISPRPVDAPKPVPAPVAPPVARIEPPKAISAPAPVPTPKPPVIAEQPVTPPQAPGAYKLPPTSKYAGRIESAGPQPVVKAAPETVVAAQKEIAAQAKEQTPPAAKPAPKPESKLATAPEPAAPLAQDIEDDDIPFVPGSRVTNPATQSPRYYSLHRAYGLQPDPTPTTGDLQLDPSQVTTREDSDKPAKK